jgi:MoaA/NifB/PqqE/SkfB family radical SAM enzyme
MRADLHAFGDKPPARRPDLAGERKIIAAARRLCAGLGLRCNNNNSYNVFMDIASAGGQRCLASDDHVFITAAGEVLPCFRLRSEKFGGLADRPLAEICEARALTDFYGRQRGLCARCDIYKKGHAA